jgi:Zn-finger nucleic acid-binding protein
MICPSCQENFKQAVFYQVEVDYCPFCLGVFFEEEELRLAKDEKDKDLNWLDIDLWKDKEKFKVSQERKLCPACQVPLYEVNYGDSEIHPVKSAKGGVAKPQFNGVKVDICNVCHGVWLDRLEFKKIIEYLKEKGNYQLLNDYFKTLTEEFKEIFVGPESLKEEIFDFLVVLKLFRYKFATQHPLITQIISSLPK